MVESGLAGMHTSDSTHSSHPLLALPDEMLVAIQSHLENNDRLSLQQASRRLYYFSAIKVQELDIDERRAFDAVLRRDKYYAAVVKEAAGTISSTHRPCRACCRVHPITAFSEAQLRRQAHKRGCMLSQRKLVICEHRSMTLLDLVLESNVNSLAKTVLDLGSERVKSFRCKHEAHMKIKLGHMVANEPALDLSISSHSGGNTAMAQMWASFKIGINPTKAIRAGKRMDYIKGVQQRMQHSAMTLCAHETTSDCEVYGRFDIRAIDRLFYRATLDHYHAFGGRCFASGCSMQFWFTWFEGEVWLMVERCELSLPKTANDQEWLACSVDSTVE